MIASSFSFFSFWKLPEEWIDTVQVIVNYAMKFDGLVPVREMFIVLFAIITFEISFFGARMLLKLVNFIRGSGQIEL